MTPKDRQAKFDAIAADFDRNERRVGVDCGVLTYEYEVMLPVLGAIGNTFEDEDRAWAFQQLERVMRERNAAR